MISTSRVINKDFMIEPKAMLITSGLGVLVNIVMGATLHQHGHRWSSSSPSPSSPSSWPYSSAMVVEWIKPWPFSWRSLLCGARSSQQSWQAQSVLIFVVVITKIFLITFIIGQSITIILMTFNFLRRKHQRLSSLYPCRRRLPPIHRCLPCCHCHLLQGDLNIFKAGLIFNFQPEWSLIDPICTFIFSFLVLGTTLTILRCFNSTFPSCFFTSGRPWRSCWRRHPQTLTSTLWKTPSLA